MAEHRFLSNVIPSVRNDVKMHLFVICTEMKLKHRFGAEKTVTLENTHLIELIQSAGGVIRPKYVMNYKWGLRTFPGIHVNTFNSKCPIALN